MELSREEIIKMFIRVYKHKINAGDLGHKATPDEIEKTDQFVNPDLIRCLREYPMANDYYVFDAYSKWKEDDYRSLD